MSISPEAQAAVAEILTAAKVVPVLTIETLESAVPLARALVDGGMATLEITLRTPVAVDAAKAIKAQVSGAVVGLGTVRTPADVALGAEVGAEFLVSPGSTPALLEAAAASPIPLVPGVATASEVMEALNRGFTVQKFFPAGAAGGRSMLKAFSGPFSEVRFCPTGGIGEADASSWLALSNVLAVGGSWPCPMDRVANGDWEGISAIAERTMAGLLPAR